MGVNYYVGNDFFGDELCHYGILGMKWGIRRYQNKDGTLTEAGKQQYRYKSLGQKITLKKAQKMSDKIDRIKSTRPKDYKAENAVRKAEQKRGEYEARAKRLKKLDDRELEYAKKVSVGATIADRMLLGSMFTSKPTQQFYAIFKNGKDSESTTVAKATVAALLTGRLGSEIARSLYARGRIGR